MYRHPESLSCVSPAAAEPDEAMGQLIMAEDAPAQAEEAGQVVELLCVLEEAGQDEEPPEEAEEARQADEGGGTIANVTDVMISKQNYTQGNPDTYRLLNMF